MASKKTSDVEVSQDVDALAPEPDVITLSSGSVVRVERLKTRGMFKLLKIITRGGGPILMNAKLDFEDQEGFVGQLLAIVVMAIPEAEEETIEFIQTMVSPAEFDPKARSAEAKRRNQELMDELMAELDDPELDDTVSIVEAIVRNEAHDIQALGKRLGSSLRTLNPGLTASAEAKN